MLNSGLCASKVGNSFFFSHLQPKELSLLTTLADVTLYIENLFFPLPSQEHGARNHLFELQHHFLELRFSGQI